MYKRSKKDDYHKKIEEMIRGQKCSRENSNNIINIDNYNTTDCNSDINDSNDDITSIASSNINNSSKDIDDNIRNDKFDINKICIQKWNPVGIRIKGIHKYLKANKVT